MVPTAIVIMGVLVAGIIVFRQVRWLVLIAVLATAGYFVHGFLNDAAHEERRDRMTVLRP